MQFVFAPDSFKGSLSAVRIVQLLCEASRKYFPEAEVKCVPVADGGEGTIDALLLTLGGRRKNVEVTGPLGERVYATYGITPDNVAIIEMAQASGLPLVRRKDPMHATSRGTGEMIADALKCGARKILLGIGGSATNDGGMGILLALGARFLDENGNQVPEGGVGLAKIAFADFSCLLPELNGIPITVMCDVINPLLGDNGATAVYGPQKGVTSELLPVIEAGMTQYTRIVESVLQRDIHTLSGSGAAGGAGAALGGVLNAKLKRGIDAILEFVGFDQMLQGTNLVVTGEGCMDRQSIAYGKVISGIAEHAQRLGIPVCAIVGSMLPGAEEFLTQSVDRSILTTVNAVMPLGCAMGKAEMLYRSAAERMFRLLRIGQRLER